jgi:hypothetical protein
VASEISWEVRKTLIVSRTSILFSTNASRNRTLLSSRATDTLNSLHLVPALPYGSGMPCIRLPLPIFWPVGAQERRPADHMSLALTFGSINCAWTRPHRRSWSSWCSTSTRPRPK